MVDDAADDAVALHLAELLDQHLLGDSRNGAFKIGEAHDPATEQVKQDHQLPPALQQFQSLFDALRGCLPRMGTGLTFR